MLQGGSGGGGSGSGGGGGSGSGEEPSPAPSISPSAASPIAAATPSEDAGSPVYHHRVSQAPSPVRHPFQAAAKVRSSIQNEADDDRTKQIARLRAKIASYKKKLAAFEDELQRLMYGEGEELALEAVPINEPSPRASESPRRKRLAGGRKKPSALAAELASGPKVKLDKSWEIDASQVYVEKVLGGTSSSSPSSCCCCLTIEGPLMIHSTRPFRIGPPTLVVSHR